jgi:hypothetical protein
VRTEELGKFEKIHFIRTRSRDLPACSIVPQPLRYRVPLVYSIPDYEVKNIIKEIVNNDNRIPIMEKQELESLLNTVLEPNYMQFNDQFYKQNGGLVIGAPTSAI